MMVGFDAVGLFGVGKKTKSAHTIDEYQTIYHQKLVPTSFSVHDEMTSTPLFFHFGGTVKMQGLLP